MKSKFDKTLKKIIIIIRVQYGSLELKTEMVNVFIKMMLLFCYTSESKVHLEPQKIRNC